MLLIEKVWATIGNASRDAKLSQHRQLLLGEGLGLGGELDNVVIKLVP